MSTNGNGHSFGDEEPTKPEVFGHAANKPVAYILYDLASALNNLSVRVKELGKKVAKKKRALDTSDREELMTIVTGGKDIMNQAALELEKHG